METKQIISWLYDKAARAQDHSYARMLNATAFKLRELEEKRRWIPVTERLPEELPSNKDKKVIDCIVAHDPYGSGKLKSQFRQRRYDKYSNKWYWAKIGCCTVTHWMPLPEPPEEVQP